MRFELVAGNNGCQLINDAYSADAGSLEAALHFLSRQADETPGQEKIVVLSDMEGSGLAEEQLCRQLAVSLQAAGTDRLFAVGPVLSRHAGVFIPYRYIVFRIPVVCWSRCRQLLSQCHHPGKGARRFRLEKVIEAWASKQHNTVLEIDLQHMAHKPACLPFTAAGAGSGNGHGQGFRLWKRRCRSGAFWHSTGRTIWQWPMAMKDWSCADMVCIFRSWS